MNAAAPATITSSTTEGVYEAYGLDTVPAPAVIGTIWPASTNRNRSTTTPTSAPSPATSSHVGVRVIGSVTTISGTTSPRSTRTTQNGPASGPVSRAIVAARSPGASPVRPIASFTVSSDATMTSAI